MDLMQWIVPDEARGGVRLLWVPTWADRTPSADGRETLLRRGPVLSSRWLAAPLAIAVDAARAVDDGRSAGLAAVPGLASLHVRFVVDGEGATPLPGIDVDDVRFASTLTEFIRCIADLCDAAGLPLMAVMPVGNRSGAAVVLGPLGGWSAQRLADTLLSTTTAWQLCALARGFATTDARLVVRDVDTSRPSQSWPIDARLEGALRRLAEAR